jgi:hypothetical protein
MPGLPPKGLSPACSAPIIQSIRAEVKLNIGLPETKREISSSRQSIQPHRRRRPPSSMRRRSYRQSSRRRIPLTRPMRTRLKTSPRAASACRRRKQARRSSRWTAIILVLFAFNVALVGARSEVVRFFPQTASLFAAVGLPVNLRNLKFENMRVSKEAQEGLSSLMWKALSSVSPTGRSRCRAFASRRAIRQDRRSTLGRRCRAAAFSAPEKSWTSAVGSYHRPTIRLT